jgi:hypothetical protein
MVTFGILGPTVPIKFSLSKGVVDGERPLNLAPHLYLTSNDILRAFQKTNSITSLIPIKKNVRNMTSLEPNQLNLLGMHEVFVTASVFYITI